MLEYTTKTYKCVGYKSIEKLINKVFGFKTDRYGLNAYSIPVGEELNNCSYTIVHVTPDDLDDDEVERAMQTKNARDLDFNLTPALCRCCKLGEIEAGEYLIEVNW